MFLNIFPSDAGLESIGQVPILEYPRAVWITVTKVANEAFQEKWGLELVKTRQRGGKKAFLARGSSSVYTLSYRSCGSC